MKTSKTVGPTRSKITGLSSTNRNIPVAVGPLSSGYIASAALMVTVPRQQRLHANLSHSCQQRRRSAARDQHFNVLASDCVGARVTAFDHSLMRDHSALAAKYLSWDAVGRTGPGYAVTAACMLSCGGYVHACIAAGAAPLMSAVRAAVRAAAAWTVTAAATVVVAAGTVAGAPAGVHMTCCRGMLSLTSGSRGERRSDRHRSAAEAVAAAAAAGVGATWGSPKSGYCNWHDVWVGNGLAVDKLDVGGSWMPW